MLVAGYWLLVAGLEGEGEKEVFRAKL